MAFSFSNACRAKAVRSTTTIKTVDGNKFTLKGARKGDRSKSESVVQLILSQEDKQLPVNAAKETIDGSTATEKNILKKEDLALNFAKECAKNRGELDDEGNPLPGYGNELDSDDSVDGVSITDQNVTVS